MKPTLLKFIQGIFFKIPLLRRHFFPVYPYTSTPQQLIFLCQCIEDTRDIKGAIAEVGCSVGSATIFLNKYMDYQNIQKDYHALDTFSGFPREDIEFEEENRGKEKKAYNQFQVNKKEWFDQTMKDNGVTRVQSTEADVNNFDLTTLGPFPSSCWM